MTEAAPLPIVQKCHVSGGCGEDFSVDQSKVQLVIDPRELTVSGLGCVAFTLTECTVCGGITLTSIPVEAMLKRDSPYRRLYQNSVVLQDFLRATGDLPDEEDALGPFTGAFLSGDDDLAVH